MAMSMGGKEGDPMVEMNTTPLIDVMLVLLTMLIITLPIQTHAVKLDMPRGNNAPPPIPPEVVDIMVDFDGTVYWNNVAVPDRATLDRYLAEKGKDDPALQAEVHLRANRLVTYEHVATVLADAQRLGVVKIGLVGNEQLMQ